MSKIFWANCSASARSGGAASAPQRARAILRVQAQVHSEKAISGVTQEQAEAINGPGLARELEALIQRAAHRTKFFAHVSRVAGTRGGASASCIQIAVRYAAWAALSRSRDERSITATCCSRCRTSWIRCTWFRWRPLKSSGVAKLRLPEENWRHREGFQLTDAGMGLTARSIRRTTASSATTRARIAAPPGSRKKTASSRKRVFGVTLAGCPLDEKISEMNVVKQHGNTDRRAGHRHHRQSDGGGHRPSHLQRLHEVLHFSEAGPGGHSAGGNAHAERRAGAAVGLRDLQPADALESA